MCHYLKRAKDVLMNVVLYGLTINASASHLPTPLPHSPQEHVQTAPAMSQDTEHPLISTTVPLPESPSLATPPVSPSLPSLPSAPLSIEQSLPVIMPEAGSAPSGVQASPIPAVTSSPPATSIMTPPQVSTEQPMAEPVGIDTMEVKGETKGNWLYKRYWWERARKLYDEIINRVRMIDTERDALVSRYTTLLTTVFTEFYQKSGYEKGELDTALTMLKADVHERKTKGVDLNEQERAAFVALEKEKEQLDQLHTTIQAVEKLTLTFDAALQLLNQQVALSISYQQQAEQLLREIEQELSDKQAKESYHQMRTLFENTLAIEQYIKSDFAHYFTTLSSKAQEQSAAVLASLTALKERGVDLSKQIESLRTKQCPSEQATTEQTPTNDEIGNVLSRWWHSLSNYISHGYQWVRSFWASSSEPEDNTVEADQVAAS